MQVMSTLFTVFLDRLAERVAALLAGLVSSRIESLHAEAQADQQSRLEDLARKYEADGKTEVAAILRQRATQLTSSNLMAEGVQVLDQVAGESYGPSHLSKLQPHDDLRSLPDIATLPRTTNRKRRKVIVSPLPSNTSPVSADNKGAMS
jgi:hypothetical protein